MLLGWIAIVVMLASLLLIPIGLPGLWIIVAVVATGSFLGHVAWGVTVAAAAIAGAAELLELFIVRGMSRRYGGSSGAFWGAVLGGLAGVVIGLPVPVIGSVLAGMVGSFAGAAAMALYESRDVAGAARVGWGVVLARVLAAFVKVAAALLILVIGGAAWIM